MIVDYKNDGVDIKPDNGTQIGTEKEEEAKRNDEFSYGYTNMYVFTNSSGSKHRVGTESVGQIIRPVRNYCPMQEELKSCKYHGKEIIHSLKLIFIEPLFCGSVTRDLLRS